VVGRAHDLDELQRLIAELAPSAVIICVRSQIVTTTATVAVAHHLRNMYPDMGIIVISDRTNDFALELLRGGSGGIAFLLDERHPVPLSSFSNQSTGCPQGIGIRDSGAERAALFGIC